MKDAIEEWRECIKCKEIKRFTDFYKDGKYKRNICKVCSKRQLISYRRLPNTYAYWYGKLNNIKNSAKTKGIEFTLTYDDYEELRNEEECYFCKTDCDLVGLTRIDRQKGYTFENTKLICRICRRFHNYTKPPLNEKEMLMIGKSVEHYYRRTRKIGVAEEPKPLAFKQWEDSAEIEGILRGDKVM